VQTAELLAKRCTGELRVDRLLAEAPGRTLFLALASLADQGFERVALVGHEPWLSEFVAWAVTGATNRAGNFSLRKGAVVWLEGDPVPGALALVASLPPQVLVEAGG
jgi:phosphohistidine phosphatase